jgi:hypothetical protein
MSAVSELMPPEWDTTAMPGTGLGGVGQEVCRLQEFVVILDPDYPALGKDRIVAGIGTRQRCSMRACSPRSESRTPDFDEDDRLAALCCELCDLEKLIGPL